MGSGGWQWRADRERWVAHAPVNGAETRFVLLFLASQVLMVVLAQEDSLVRIRPWVLVPWAAVVLTLAGVALWRSRRRRVTYDGEVVEISGGLVRTRFRPADVTAVWAGSPLDRQLVTLRVRRPDRRIGGRRLPAVTDTRSVAAMVPAWWWHQVVGIPPELGAERPLRRLWSQVRRRRRPAAPAPTR